MDNKVYGYHIFPPYIDAYQNHFNTEELLPLDIIQQKAEGHACEWGSKVIGDSILENKEIPMIDGKYILCCIYLYKNQHVKEKDLLIVFDPKKEFEGYWFNNVEMIEGNINPDWDVT